MNSRVDMDKLDYTDTATILQELYDGRRQPLECNFVDFFDIPVNEGYKTNKERAYDFDALRDTIKTQLDLSNNIITVTDVATTDSQ